jgi:hypothetical protein
VAAGEVRAPTNRGSGALARPSLGAGLLGLGGNWPALCGSLTRANAMARCLNSTLVNGLFFPRHAAGERIVAARIEDHEAQSLHRFQRLHDAVEAYCSRPE